MRPLGPYLAALLLPALLPAAEPGRSGWDDLVAYEPTWFLLSTEQLDAKFQFSLATRLVGPPEERPAAHDDPARGLYFSYSQTSLWDLTSWSKPFYDSSYRPEIWWRQDAIPTGPVHVGSLAIEAGLGHESNGKSEEDGSRSLNKAFVRPVARWDLPDGADLRLRPRFYALVGDLSDNPDIARYRGNVDLDLDGGWAGGWRFGTQMRIGSDWDRLSVQLDASYPLARITRGWMGTFAWVQVFDGWGESLLDYDQRSVRLLFGLGLVR